MDQTSNSQSHSAHHISDILSVFEHAALFMVAVLAVACTTIVPPKAEALPDTSSAPVVISEVNRVSQRFTAGYNTWPLGENATAMAALKRQYAQLRYSNTDVLAEIEGKHRDFDIRSRDDEALDYIELYNRTGSAQSLSGYVLVTVSRDYKADDGYNNPKITNVIDLGGYAIAANGHFVIGSEGVPNVNLIVNPVASKRGWIQNAGPDSSDIIVLAKMSARELRVGEKPSVLFDMTPNANAAVGFTANTNVVDAVAVSNSAYANAHAVAEYPNSKVMVLERKTSGGSPEWTMDTPTPGFDNQSRDIALVVETDMSQAKALGGNQFSVPVTVERLSTQESTPVTFTIAPKNSSRLSVDDSITIPAGQIRATKTVNFKIINSSGAFGGWVYFTVKGPALSPYAAGSGWVRVPTASDATAVGAYIGPNEQLNTDALEFKTYFNVNGEIDAVTQVGSPVEVSWKSSFGGNLKMYIRATGPSGVVCGLDVYMNDTKTTVAPASGVTQNIVALTGAEGKKSISFPKAKGGCKYTINVYDHSSNLQSFVGYASVSFLTASGEKVEVQTPTPANAGQNPGVVRVINPNLTDSADAVNQNAAQNNIVVGTDSRVVVIPGTNTAANNNAAAQKSLAPVIPAVDPIKTPAPAVTPVVQPAPAPKTVIYLNGKTGVYQAKVGTSVKISWSSSNIQSSYATVESLTPAMCNLPKATDKTIGFGKSGTALLIVPEAYSGCRFLYTMHVTGLSGEMIETSVELSVPLVVAPKTSYIEGEYAGAEQYVAGAETDSNVTYGAESAMAGVITGISSAISAFQSVLSEI